MTHAELADALGAFPLGNLCNADSRVTALDPAVTPLFQGARLSGQARTARISPGQNAAIHMAVHAAAPGDVLIVDAGGDRGHGPFGDILAACCMEKGVRGLVIDGTIRDTAEIREMGFPVFCLGANPTATAKKDPGAVDVDIDCGGVAVRPGDFIVGDDDGVVVVPRAIAAAVIEGAAAVDRREIAIKARLAAGESTAEIFGLV